MTYLKHLTFACLLLVGQDLLAITLGEALDAEGLVWSVGGDGTWQGTNAPSYDGVDAGITVSVDDNQSAWVSTTVVGPGTISWWWSCITEEGYDVVDFSVNNLSVPGYEISGPQNWEYRSLLITNVGPVTLQWRYARDGSEGLGANEAYLDQVKFKTGPVATLDAALNTTTNYASWSTGGNANPTYWEAQTNMFHTDGIAAESGAIYTSQESWLEAKTYGVTNASFWWKVSSVTNHGRLAFLVNGSTNAVITGEVGWQSKTNISLPAGTNTLRWVCFTDESAIGKLNRGWVDQVTFDGMTSGPSAPLVLGTPAVSNGIVRFNLNFEAGWPCRILYSTNLAANEWLQLLATNTTSTVTVIVDTSATNSPAGRFYRAAYP